MISIGFIVWLIVVILIAAAVLGVVRAVLALPVFASLQPYVGVVYALIVLLIVLLCASMLYNGGPGAPVLFHHPR